MIGYFFNWTAYLCARGGQRKALALILARYEAPQAAQPVVSEKSSDFILGDDKDEQQDF